MKTFFDAAELHVSVKTKEIGIATIYRFCKNAEKEGILHSFTCNGRKIYSRGKRHHCHFHCELCETVTHIHLKDITFLQTAIKGKTCHFQLDVHGICMKCEKK